MNPYFHMHVKQCAAARAKLAKLLANVPADQVRQIFDEIHKLEYAIEKLAYREGVMAERNEIFLDSNTSLPEFMKGDAE